MQLDGDGRALGDLEGGLAALLQAMGQMKANRGAMFAATF
jgi:hypothetical protein